MRGARFTFQEGELRLNFAFLEGEIPGVRTEALAAPGEMWPSTHQAGIATRCA